MIKIAVSSDNFDELKKLHEGDSILIVHTDHPNKVITMKKAREYDLDNSCMWAEDVNDYRTQCGFTIDGDFFNIARGDKLSFCPGCGKQIFES